MNDDARQMVLAIMRSLSGQFEAEFVRHRGRPKRGRAYLVMTSKVAKQVCVEFELVEQKVARDQHLVPNSECVYVTNPLSAKQRLWCLENHVQFIDAAGNFFLAKEGIHLCVSNMKKKPIVAQFAPDFRWFHKQKVRCLFALFAEPELQGMPMSVIAKRAGVSQGLVCQLLGELVERGFREPESKTWVESELPELEQLWVDSCIAHFVRDRPFLSSHVLLKSKLHNLPGVIGEFVGSKDSELEEFIYYPKTASDLSTIEESDKGCLVFVVSPFWNPELAISTRAVDLLIRVDTNNGTLKKYKAQLMDRSE